MRQGARLCVCWCWFKTLICPARIVALLVVSGSAYLQSTMTATCQDSTSFSDASRRGACARHSGGGLHWRLERGDP